MIFVLVKVQEVVAVSINQRLIGKPSISDDKKPPPAKKFKVSKSSRKEEDQRLLQALREGQALNRTDWQQQKYDEFVKSRCEKTNSPPINSSQPPSLLPSFSAD